MMTVTKLFGAPTLGEASEAMIEFEAQGYPVRHFVVRPYSGGVQILVTFEVPNDPTRLGGQH